MVLGGFCFHTGNRSTYQWSVDIHLAPACLQKFIENIDFKTFVSAELIVTSCRSELNLIIMCKWAA